jgi:hypothetical protein
MGIEGFRWSTKIKPRVGNGSTGLSRFVGINQAHSATMFLEEFHHAAIANCTVLCCSAVQYAR